LIWNLLGNFDPGGVQSLQFRVQISKKFGFWLARRGWEGGWSGGYKRKSLSE
jgi:hypothetical protein